MVDAKMRSECDEPVVPAITTSVFVWKLWKYRVAIYIKVMTMFFPIRQSSHESWLSSSQLALFLVQLGIPPYQMHLPFTGRGSKGAPRVTFHQLWIPVLLRREVRILKKVVPMANHWAPDTIENRTGV